MSAPIAPTDIDVEQRLRMRVDDAERDSRFGDAEDMLDGANKIARLEVMVKHYQDRLRTIAKHPDTPEIIRQYAVGLLDTDGMPAP